MLYQSPCFAVGIGENLRQLLTKEIIMAGIITGLIGLVPIVVQVISNRAQRKSHGHRLANLAAELDFLEKWTNLLKEHQPHGVINQTETTGATVVSDLENILSQFQSLRTGKEKHEKKPIPEVSFLRRVFLLFLPVSVKGWIYHTLFYVLLLVPGSMIISEFLFPVESSQGTLLYLFIGLVIIFGLPLAILSRKANRDRNLHIEMQNASSDS
jgi:hypothetical protein